MSNNNSKKYKYLILLIVMLSSFLSPFMIAGINVALPSIQKEFNINTIELSWVAISFLLSSTILLVPIGKIGDLFGRRKIFLIGLIIYIIGSFLSAISHSSLMLIIYRIIQGVGGAFILGTSMAILTSVFPIWERGKVLGLNAASIHFAVSIGPFLGGILTENFGWRSIFWFNLFVGIIALFLSLIFYEKETTVFSKEKFDVIGSIIYSLTVIGVMYGLSIMPSMFGAILILISLIGIMILIWWESRYQKPMLDVMHFFNNKTFTFSNLSQLFISSGGFAVHFVLSLYLQFVKGFSPQKVGYILLVQPLVQLFISPFSGRLSDKIEPRIISSIGAGFITFGIYMLSNLEIDSAIIFITISLIFNGIGMGLFASPNANAVMSSVEVKDYGIASATLQTIRQTGQILSVSVASVLISFSVGNLSLSETNDFLFLKGVKTTMLVFSILAFLGIFSSIYRGKILPNSEHNKNLNELNS